MKKLGESLLYLVLISSLFFTTLYAKNLKSTDRTMLSPIPIIYSPKFKISLMGLEKLHPFDIAKYDKIYSQLEKEGFVTQKSVIVPNLITDDQLKLIHTQEYLDSLSDPAEVSIYLEVPVISKIPKKLLKSNLIDRFKLASGGTIEASEQALKKGYAVLIGGGYHHAKPSKGEGFCVIADVPIAIKKLQKEQKIKRALIIDTDVHQGNGTILCLKDDPSTFTFSMHEKGIYPTPKEKGDLDIELASGMEDNEYLQELAKQLPIIFSKAKPDIVFYVAGCDTLHDDPLANLKMTHQGIVKRDLMVAKYCYKKQIPFVMTLAGGYSKNAWKAQYLSIKNIIEFARSNQIKPK